MKTIKTLILSSLMVLACTAVNADKKSNLIYNSEEVNGMKVAETVYKMDGGMLANYMKYSYKYDDQNRKTESEALKWDGSQWQKDVCMHYTYQGKSMTTTYYKWNSKKGEYVLVPEMTITMDNPDM